MNTSPGTAGQALVNEIASWTEEELDAKIAAALAKGCGSTAADWCLADNGVECTQHEQNGDRR